jgi:hypothetical protein
MQGGILTRKCIVYFFQLHIFCYRAYAFIDLCSGGITAIEDAAMMKLTILVNEVKAEGFYKKKEQEEIVSPEKEEQIAHSITLSKT